MTWSERNTTDDGQKSRTEDGEYVRIFDVDGPAHTALLPQTGKPSKGDAHPRIPGVFVADFRIKERGNFPSRCEAEAVYTTEAGVFGSQPAQFYKREAQFRRAEQKVPVVRQVFTRPLGAPVTDPKLPEYTTDFITIEEWQPIVQRHVVLSSFTQAMEDAIMAQAGKLHLFGGRVLRFEPGDVIQHGSTTPGEWRVMYTWYGDRGTRALKATAIKTPLFSGGGSNGEPVSLPNPVSYGSGASAEDKVLYFYPKSGASLLPAVHASFPGTGTFIRSPFHVFQIVMHPLDPPEFIQFCPFEADPTGWNTLPGGPLP